MAAIDDIAAERHRQIEQKGWTPEHDAAHIGEELAAAAACYALPSEYRPADCCPAEWPWADIWWKPGDRRRELVKAAALIVAEIDRLDRKGRSTWPTN